MRTLKFFYTASILGLLLLFGGCYYDEILPEDLKVNNDFAGDVSFSADLLPIFNKDCNTSGCHNTGGTKPDLTPANAFNALNNGGYINIVSPEQSELYLWMRGNRSLPMPLSGPNATYNAKVLAWIRQGAQNN